MRRWPGALVLAVGCFYATLSAGPVVGPASAAANVEALALAAKQAGLVFYITPRGSHVAAIVQQGSRFAVAYDGVAGPPFDAIVADTFQRKVQFSPDNSRYAYVGRSGDQYVVMIDGKESMRLPVATTQWNASGLHAVDRQAINLMPSFTSNSKHVYFMVRTGSASAPTGSPASLHDDFYFDRQIATTSASRAQELSLSPDGDHYALVVSNPLKREQLALIVDGKPAGYVATDPRFTANGKNLITRVEQPLTNSVELLLDGKPWLKARSIRLYVGPVGASAVAVVRSNSADQEILVLNGKRIGAASRVHNVYYSPDGAHFAAECETAANSRFMVVDGRKELEYEFFLPSGPGTETILFSPDSARYAYIARSGAKQFVVVDGKESDGFDQVSNLKFSADGKRVGFTANSAAAGPRGMARWVVVDGKPQRHDDQLLSDFTFSPDGSRHGYIVGSVLEQHLVVDGVEDAKSPCCEFFADQRAARVLFSPDGRHVVTFGTKPEKSGFSINGRVVPPPSRGWVINPSFSPDGRNFFFTQQSTPQSLAIYANGHPATEIDGLNENRELLTATPGAWEVGSDGVLTVIAFAGDSLQRIRVTPAPNTSFEAFAGTARR